MKFRVTTMLWAFALLASAMATFGTKGIFAAICVLWLWWFLTKKPAPTLLELLTVVTILGFLVGLLLPAVQVARSFASRAQCRSNLKQLSLALLKYTSTSGAFPAATRSEPNSDNLHSWRISALSFIGPLPFDIKYRLEESWNSDNNSNYVKRLRAGYVFQCHSHIQSADVAHYLAVVGEHTMWPPGRGRKINEITDGTSNTIMLIEASHKAIPWAKPEDLSFEEAVELLTSPPATDNFGHDVAEGFFTSLRG